MSVRLKEEEILLCPNEHIFIFFFRNLLLYTPALDVFGFLFFDCAASTSEGIVSFIDT